MTTFDGSTEPDRRAAREVEAVLCSKLSEAEFFYLLAQGHLDDVTLTGRAGAEEAAAVLRERRLRKNERNTASVAKQDRAASLQRFERAVSAARWAWARHSREVIQFRRDHLGDGPIPVEEIETWRSANPRAAHEADRVAADLEDLHFWESGDGVAFLLADSLPMVNVISISAVREGPVMKTAFLLLTKSIASGRDGRMFLDSNTVRWISGSSDPSNS